MISNNLLLTSLRALSFYDNDFFLSDLMIIDIADEIEQKFIRYFLYFFYFTEIRKGKK